MEAVRTVEYRAEIYRPLPAGGWSFGNYIGDVPPHAIGDLVEKIRRLKAVEFTIP